MLYRQVSVIQHRRKHDAHCETIQEMISHQSGAGTSNKTQRLVRVSSVSLNLDSFSKASPVSFHD